MAIKFSTVKIDIDGTEYEMYKFNFGTQHKMFQINDKMEALKDSDGNIPAESSKDIAGLTNSMVEILAELFVNQPDAKILQRFSVENLTELIQALAA